MDIAFAQTWPKAASAVVIGVGLLLAVGAWPPLAGPIVFLADLIIWPLDGVQTLGAPETRVFMAISGGVMVGWGVTLWKMTEHLLAEHPNAVRSIAMTGLYCWFTVDSIASVAAGVPINAVFNMSFVALFLFAFRQRREVQA
jgi:hypothetical protein